MSDKCMVCEGKAKWPISEEERNSLKTLPKSLPLNNSCNACDVTGKESVRLRREKEGKNEKFLA